MRKLIVLVAAVVVMMTSGAVLAAEQFGADPYDDSQSNPLRIAAYLLHPVGYTLEWLVTRPFHEFVAQPDLEPIFGHESHAYYGESPLGATTTGDISVRRTKANDWDWGG
jgi:hypothetical protein